MTTEIKGGLLAQGSDSEVVRVLGAARALIAKGWTQGAPARDGAGHHVGTKDPVALCWCSCGALGASTALDDAGLLLYEHARCLLKQVVGASMVSLWNDAEGRTQAEVLAAFDRAIALASNASDPKGPPSPSSPALDPQETK